MKRLKNYELQYNLKILGQIVKWQKNHYNPNSSRCMVAYATSFMQKCNRLENPAYGVTKRTGSDHSRSAWRLVRANSFVTYEYLQKTFFLAVYTIYNNL